MCVPFKFHVGSLIPSAVMLTGGALRGVVRPCVLLDRISHFLLNGLRGDQPGHFAHLSIMPCEATTVRHHLRNRNWTFTKNLTVQHCEK